LPPPWEVVVDLEASWALKGLGHVGAGNTPVAGGGFLEIST